MITYVTDRPGHDRRYALNCSKMESELQWTPKISLQSGLEQTVQWYRDNGEWKESIRRGEYLNYYAKYYDNRDSSLEGLMSAGREAGVAPAGGN